MTNVPEGYEGVCGAVDIVVQYSRMDTTQAEMALMSVMAFPVQ